MIAAAAIEPETLAYLAGSFCDGDLCRYGSWAEWVIVAPDSVWTVQELQVVRMTLVDTIGALEKVGLDGRILLGGYRFRRVQGIYLHGRLGKVARVQHDTQEILLSDGALKKQWGFYIYHELGHIVDLRLERRLTHEFHRLACGENAVCGDQTADGFWLDRFARERPQEATADAFALWVILYHTSSPPPVFWMKPDQADYGTIAATMDTALHITAHSI